MDPNLETLLQPSRADLETLIHAATLAPSPDNNQPWLFEQRSDDELLLLHDRSRALPSDVNDMFSMIALGAALENLCLASGQRGWRAIVRYPEDLAPEAEGREIAAAIRFTDGGTADPLAAFLEQRVTNRKPYSRHPVAADALRQIEMSIAAYPGLQLHWISHRPLIRSLARLVASTDRIRFEHQPFHAELYRQLRFTPQEAETMRDGLDVRCLELPAGAAALLRWLRDWPRMRMLNRMRLSRLLSLASAVQVWRTGTMGFLTTTDVSKRGFLHAGRALQRVWLKATQLGLAFHPLGSMPIFLSYLADSTTDSSLSQYHKSLQGIAQTLEKIVPGTTGRSLVMVFRLGKTSAPSVRSVRLPGVLVYKSSV